jgi:hypothetical protein
MIQGTLHFWGRVQDDDKNPLRTGSVVGFTATSPTVGEHFSIFAEPLDDTQDVRWIRTTKVEKVEGDMFFTRNSIYRWECSEKLRETEE